MLRVAPWSPGWPWAPDVLALSSRCACFCFARSKMTDTYQLSSASYVIPAHLFKNIFYNSFRQHHTLWSNAFRTDHLPAFENLVSGILLSCDCSKIIPMQLDHHTGIFCLWVLFLCFVVVVIVVVCLLVLVWGSEWDPHACFENALSLSYTLKPWYVLSTSWNVIVISNS